VAEDRMDSHVKVHQNELHGALVTFSQVDTIITSKFLYLKPKINLFSLCRCSEEGTKFEEKSCRLSHTPTMQER